MRGISWLHWGRFTNRGRRENWPGFKVEEDYRANYAAL